MTDRPSGTQSPASTAESGTEGARPPRGTRWLLGFLALAVVATAAGAALNSAALALPGALVAAVAVAAYDKTR